MRYVLLAATVAALTLQACGSDSTAPGTAGSASLRLASASPDAGALDLLVNGRTVAHAVGHTQASPVANVPAGSATGEVRASGSSVALATLPLTLEAGQSYTVLAAGPVGALNVMVSVDTSGSEGGAPPPPVPVDSGTPPPPPTNAATFRLVHAAPDAPPLDVYLVPAGAPLDTLPTLQPFAYGSLALTADLVRCAGQLGRALHRPGHHARGARRERHRRGSGRAAHRGAGRERRPVASGGRGARMRKTSASPCEEAGEWCEVRNRRSGVVTLSESPATAMV